MSVTNTLSSEASLLATMLMHNELVEKIHSRVPVESFVNEHNRLIYKTALDVFQRHKRLDLVLLNEALGSELLAVGGASYLAAILENAPDPDVWEPYAKSVLDKFHLSTIRQGCLDTADFIDQGGDVSDAVGRVQALSAVKPSTETVPFRDMLARSIGDLDAQRTCTDVMKFGYKPLDQAIGGLRRGKMYAVGGKTSQGKTTFALNVVVNNLKSNKDVRVVYNAFEDMDQLTGRLVALEHGVKLDWFMNPGRLVPGDYKLLQEKMEDLAKYNDRLVFLSGVKNSRLREVCTEWKPDLVVVDYLQSYAHRYALSEDGRLSHEVGKVVEGLRQMAIEKGCAVLVLSQFSRRMEEQRNRRPTLNDFKESGDIENASDACLLLWWRYHESSNEPPNEYQVLVDKNKMGARAELRLHLNLDTLKLSDLKP